MNLLFLCLVVTAAPAPRDSVELARLLNEFLAGAGAPGAAVHQRFWADDLIYTGSSGRRVGKADILRDIAAAPAPRPGDPEVAYSAEEVRIQQYGSTALVAFRLVAATRDRGGSAVTRYLNTGMFVKRNGRWEAAGWQATRVPPSEDEARQGALAASQAFQAALSAADTSALAALVDPGFQWTRRSADAMTRRQLFDALAAGRSPAAPEGATSVSVHGETAIARGVRPEDFTLTLVRHSGAWRVAALSSN